MRAVTTEIESTTTSTVGTKAVYKTRSLAVDRCVVNKFDCVLALEIIDTKTDHHLATASDVDSATVSIILLRTCDRTECRGCTVRNIRHEKQRTNTHRVNVGENRTVVHKARLTDTTKVHGDTTIVK